MLCEGRLVIVDATEREARKSRISQLAPSHNDLAEALDGRERPYYGAWLDADDTPQQWRIPLALNDPPGPWTITATDVISGVSATETFDLTER